MNWQLKAQIQNVIAMLPRADSLYYGLQRTCGSFRPGRTAARDWLEASAQLASWVEASGRTVAGARFLEVGTGRTVMLPLALWLWGAERVVTVDLNRYLMRTLVFETIDYIRAHHAQVERIFGARGGTQEFQTRLAQLLSFSGSLQDLLLLMNVEYLSPADAEHLPLPDHSFDFHVSHAVLEHVPAAALPGILAEARRVLVPGGLLYHVIDPSDHFSHEDSSITAINFLQFSDREWERIAGNKFTFHNRLRSFEFQTLFKRAGVHILRQSETLDESSLGALRNGFPLHAQFSHIASDALAVRSLIVLGAFEERS